MAISEEDVEYWLKTKNTRMVGRGYEVLKKDDRAAFKKWLVNLVEEIERGQVHSD